MDEIRVNQGCLQHCLTFRYIKIIFKSESDTLKVLDMLAHIKVYFNILT